MPRNGTYRELERRVLAHRKATGRDLDGLWISGERWNMLPESVRGNGTGWSARSQAEIAGVPVRVLQILQAGEL